MTKYEEAFSKYNFLSSMEEISQKVADLSADFRQNNTPEVLRLIYSCLDLTSLNTDDSKERIWRFVEQVNKLDGENPQIENVAAVCVYPNFVATVKEALTADVAIAAVAAGFPSGQTFSEVKIAEISLAIADGADEIDIVFPCGEFLDENYEEVGEELSEIKAVCREAKLKIILETGLLQTPINIKKAAILSMYSGADFLKTSTGKGYSGASPEAVYILCETIKEYYRLHDKQIGIKVSGGVRTLEDALLYYTIVKEVLGEAWLTPEYFRIGASALADELLKKMGV